MTKRLPPAKRADFGWFAGITLRWNDIDIFGHVNNARYYEFFDTAVVSFLHQADFGLGMDGAAVVVAENGCRFHREVKFTDRLELGLRVEHIGNSSVRYGLAAFVNGESSAAADGHFIHVFVDPASKRPMPFSATVRNHLSSIEINPA